MSLRVWAERALISCGWESGVAGLGEGGGQELGFGHVFSCLLDSQTGVAGKHRIGVGQSGKM